MSMQPEYKCSSDVGAHYNALSALGDPAAYDIADGDVERMHSAGERQSPISDKLRANSGANYHNNLAISFLPLFQVMKH